MSTRGRLLSASPSLLDENFARAVVFMLEHSVEGALGLVLNQPSELPAIELFPGWGTHASAPAQMFRGGPVSMSSVICLATASPLTVPAYHPITDEIGTIDLDGDPGEAAGVSGLRLFAGYASWGPGQLEGELADDAWFVFDAEPGDVTAPNPEQLWWDVFARQAGPVRRLANYPADPWSN